jgi:hypothetical protein
VNDSVVADPAFPDIVGIVGAPLIPCKVTELTATMAPTEPVWDGSGAHYDQMIEDVAKYQPTAEVPDADRP